MENRNAKVAAVVIAGLAAGAATWYFMKSENGRQNWSAIVDAVKDFSDKIKDSSSTQKDNLANLSDKASDYLSDKAGEATNFSSDTIEDISQKASEQAKSYS